MARVGVRARAPGARRTPRRARLECGGGPHGDRTGVRGARRRRWRARGGRSHCSGRVGVTWESAAGQSEAGGVARVCQSGNPGLLVAEGPAFSSYYYYIIRY